MVDQMGPLSEAGIPLKGDRKRPAKPLLRWYQNEKEEVCNRYGPGEGPLEAV